MLFSLNYPEPRLINTTQCLFYQFTHRCHAVAVVLLEAVLVVVVLLLVVVVVAK